MPNSHKVQPSRRPGIEPRIFWLGVRVLTTNCANFAHTYFTENRKTYFTEKSKTSLADKRKTSLKELEIAVYCYSLANVLFSARTNHHENNEVQICPIFNNKLSAITGSSSRSEPKQPICSLAGAIHISKLS